VGLTAQEVLSVSLTGNDEDDATVGSRMLQGHTHRIKSFKSDGAHGKFGFRAVSESDTEQVIPPLGNAAVRLPKKKNPCPLI
jgi:hypothetical protein